MLVALDFETKEIELFPNYPPEPTMLGIYVVGEEPRYLSWGHPSGNNCTEGDAKGILKKYWDDPEVELIFHNRPFDVAVAHKHWGLDLHRKGKSHDTLVMAFLLDPHAYTYALKPLSEKLLGMPPEERDAIQDYLLEHSIIQKRTKDWGKHICKVPADIVGPYCVGDVVRTVKLMTDVFWPQLQDAEMLDAYQREIDLQPIMLENSFEGICVDVARLTNDCATYENTLNKIHELLFQMLETEPFNVDSDAQLADAIDARYPGLDWAKTPTGKRSTSKANMEKTLEGIGGKLGAVLQYRASISTCLETFLKPWLLQATMGDRRIRCTWNTTRSDTAGARTGRLSSTPNFQNIPTLESPKFAHAVALHKEWLFDFPSLPNVRSYILPDTNEHVLLDRDFSSIELRVMSHYEDGAALKAYQENPQLDLHQWAADYINQNLGLPITRKQTKNCSFAILYGSGLSTLAKTMGSTVAEAASLKDAYLEALPGIKKIIKGLKARAAMNLPFRTWGGRVYYCEPASFKDGRWRTFDYKMLNYLCQGGAADIMKEAIILYHKAKVHGRLLLTIHDEFVISVPKQHWYTEMRILQNCMDNIKLDAPLMTEGKVGSNLHSLVLEADYA